MKHVLRVFADTGTNAHPLQRIQCRDRFLNTLLVEFGNRSELGDGCVEIAAASRADLAEVRRAAELCGVGFTYAVENIPSPSEYKRASFVRLRIDGEPVDEDEDGHALNLYPVLSCTHCEMPSEISLPEPYVVSRGRVSDREGSWGEEPPLADREMFVGSMGVFVVASRVREVFEQVVGGQVKYSPVVFEDSGLASWGPFWAVRPIVNWGVQIGRVEHARCSHCWNATEARLNTEGFTPFDDASHRVEQVELPNAEIVCADGWFGNRREEPFGYWRDVYVSGRLYSLLRHLKIRGLSPPQDVVWVGDSMPMKSAREVSAWLRKHETALSDKFASGKVPIRATH